MSTLSGCESENAHFIPVSLLSEAEDPFSGHGPSRGYRPATRESSANTSHSSIDGTWDSGSHPRRSIVTELGQNAISTLLRPPILWTGVPPRIAIHSTSQKPPTSRDIPPVTLTTVLTVDPSTFKEYLRDLGPLFDTFQHTKLTSGESGIERFYKDISATKGEECMPRKRRKTSPSKHGQTELPPLSIIPSVYFDKNFRLENPRIFDVVSEHAEVLRPPLSIFGDHDKGVNGAATDNTPHPARKTLTTNAMLQEKLSWYMDNVEIHLIFSISQASSCFYAALDSLRSLQEEIANSVKILRKMRKHLRRLDEDMVVHNLKIIGLKRRRDNLRKLGDAAKQLQYVLNGANHCEDLVDSGQLETAVQHISYVEHLAFGTLDANISRELHWLLPDPSIKLIDLRKLHALGGSLQGIKQLRQRIWKGYETRLLNILLCDLRRHVFIVPSKGTLAHWTDATKSARGAGGVSMTNTEKLREQLIPVIQELSQSQRLVTVSTLIREAVIREMKTLIFQHLPNSPNDKNKSVMSVPTQASSHHLIQQERLSYLSQNLRALSSEDAEAFFVKVYCGIGEALRRLSVQIKVLLDITSGIKKMSSTIRTPVETLGNRANLADYSPSVSACNVQKETTQTLDLSCLLVQAVDETQSDIIKMLQARTEQTVRLGLASFLSHVRLNLLFVSECEAVSANSGGALKDIVYNQVDSFIRLLHEAEKQKLVQKMGSEKWERIDIKPQDALTLRYILQSMTTDPPAWLGYTDGNTIALETGEQDLWANPNPAESTSTFEKEPTLATIGEEKFMLTDSTVFALRCIEQYAIFLTSIPSKTNEISTVLLDYIKLYNSLTQQLILGAGAKITAGLININTKHLALASQSLSFFIALLPYVRELVRRRLSFTVSSIVEYDRLKSLLQDHRSSIHDKVIDIMSFRTTSYIKEMEKIKWDDHDEVQRNVSPHMETLTKEALTLQRILSKYLPALSVRTIVRRVFENYKEKWSKAFEAASIRTEAGKARLLRDAELLKANLDKIDGAEELGVHMINIATAKQIT
ncbi:hypothetical protein LOZ53_004732 [Ophidiomyces ophidiicola]|nr:hypothetical protein LOZ55_001507 [Ophidiomyces ophidiicola]KAI1986071.1 hypothetical protein LOZ54_004019 [Ophidiomyces ophidiicola]KAI1986314.1 hypothetical protein LOZ53_004732 [Ophidiomyces ophidiicola]KAI2003453.1 hypothetical protein LOZ51_000533 [Ophidiomyces ophidiicola]